MAADRRIVLAIVAVGLAARLATAIRADIHADELYDLFAAQMIWQHGIPIYPSGMLWVAGGPLTYVEAPFVALFGIFSHFGRLPSVAFSTLSVWVLYRLGEQMFGRGPAIAAALAWALDPDAVLWGAYARQYGLHPLMFFLSMLLIRRSALDELPGRGSVGAALVVIVTCWVQPPTLLFLPGLAAAYVVWAKRLHWLRLMPAILCVVVGSAAVVALVYFGDRGLMQSAKSEGGVIVLPAATFGAALAMAHRFIPFLTSFPARTLLLFAAGATTAIGALQWFVLLRARGAPLSPQWRDVLALALLLSLSLLGLGLFRYQQTGYALALLGPVFLLGSAGLGQLANALGGVRGLMSAAPAIVLWAPTAIVLLSLIPGFPILRHNLQSGQGDGQFEAYAYVGERWRAGDAWLNANIVAWIYATEAEPRLFYLCADACGLGLAKGKDGYVNRFIGSPQIRSVEEVSRILDAHPRVWFVVKQADWENDERMPPDIRRLISDRMKVVFRRNAATVFCSGVP